MPTTVGIDVGGSSVKGIVRDPAGAVQERYEAAASFSTGQDVVEATVAAYRQLAPPDCRSLGVGIPGQVDVEGGSVSLAVNLGLGDAPFDLARRLEAHLGVPVAVENDVRAAVVGAQEILARSGTSPSSLALVSIGTGVAAGVLVNGALIRGSHGMAGEIGHVVIDEDGPPCPCGQRGCLEALVSGPAIARAWRKGGRDRAATALFAAAADGKAEAERIAAGITRHLTTALSWLAAAYDTELLALGGGVAAAGDNLLHSVRDEIGRRAAASELAARRLRPEQLVLIDPSQLPGAIGAASLAAHSTIHKAVSARTESKRETRKQQGGTV